jgi:hypothetical protein
MKNHKKINLLIIILFLLTGCMATSGLTKEESLYMEEISKKEYDLVFSPDEIDEAWARGSKFLSKYYSLASNNDSEIQTNYNYNSHIYRFTLKKIPSGENTEIKIDVYTENTAVVLFRGTIERDILLIQEYINTGKVKHANIFVP